MMTQRIRNERQTMAETALTGKSAPSRARAAGSGAKSRWSWPGAGSASRWPGARKDADGNAAQIGYEGGDAVTIA